MKWNRYSGCVAFGNLALAFIVLAIIILLVSFADRGLGMTDEGIALVSTRHPDQMFAALSAYFDYTSIAFSLLNYNIAGFRVMGMVLLSGAGVLLGTGLSRWLQNDSLFDKVPTFSLALFCAIGSLFYYCYWSNTITYNALNAFAITAGTGLLLWGTALVIEKENRWNISANGFFWTTGMVVGLDFFLKFPSAIVSGCLYGLAIAFLSGPTLRTKIGIGLVMLAGFASWCALHFIFIKPPLAVLRSGVIAYSALAHLGDQTNPQGHYGRDISLVLMYTAEHFWPLFLIVGIGFAFAEVARWCRFNSRPWLLWIILGAYGGIILVSWQDGFAQGGWKGGTQYMEVFTSWLALFIWFLVLGLIYFRDEPIDWTGSKRLIWAILLCGAGPFLAAVGTGNAIYTNTVMCLGPWFGLLAMLLLMVAKLYSPKIIYWTGVLSISLLTAMQMITGPLQPYGLNKNMFEQTVPTDIGDPPYRLKMDPESSRFCIDLRKIFHENGFKPGEDVLPFFYLPALVYIVGGQAPGTPWFFGHDLVSGGDGYDDVYLSFVPTERLKKAWIIEDDSCTRDSPNLRKHGLNFPDDYILCGKLHCPQNGKNISIWKPKN